ncbi:MAG: hypothetical protein JWQ90_3098 [Hydrocarboniphaga sp.]|uniref:hypothetical protein n=1 Tax=Hydrocarboniphaga sp. TaxID=2033016 RepID=UPI00261D84FA|nr:hypothetical protein [Hydrocarboniphaga sp.]MDB5970648.1 hypothetical protein [Hydrocarboniphaga sp.]
MKFAAMLILGLIAAPVIAAPGEKPSVDTQAAAGSNIVGEQESAVGLYLMPWQEETAGDVDRPPALVDEPLKPVDTTQFEGQVRTDASIAAYRRAGVNRN